MAAHPICLLSSRQPLRETLEKGSQQASWALRGFGRGGRFDSLSRAARSCGKCPLTCAGGVEHLRPERLIDPHDLLLLIEGAEQHRTRRAGVDHVRRPCGQAATLCASVLRTSANRVGCLLLAPGLWVRNLLKVRARLARDIDRRSGLGVHGEVAVGHGPPHQRARVGGEASPRTLAVLPANS